MSDASDRGAGGRRTDSAAPAVAALRRALSGLAQVRGPGEAEEPILAPAVRSAIFEWLAEIRNAEELEAVGLKPRTSALLSGPPGTGKTTLAHHLSARLGVPMVLVGSERLMSDYMNQSAANIGKLFDALQKAEQPCIVFLDELDALGSKRTDGGGDTGTDRNAALTVLLRRVEEFAAQAAGSMLLGATNRPDALDSALWRRFGMQLVVDLPGGDERWAILKRYGLPFAFEDEALDLLTDLTEGASPALLRGLMEGLKRALVLWPRQNRDPSDVCAVLRSVVAGLKPPPECPAPPLWAETSAIAALGGITWPPARL